jgi:hypothetical protein
MTQKAHILAYVKEFGSITPAHMGGVSYLGQKFPSEIKRRCCEMRDAKILLEGKDGKFARFYLKQAITLPPAFKVAPLAKPEINQPLFS